MEIRKTKKNAYLIIALLIFAALICVFCVRQKKINDTVLVSGVFSAKEISGLEKYKNLEVLNADGSLCYAELCDYAERHPEVDVSYTVDADGVIIGNKQKSVNFYGYDLNKLIAVFRYLPDLKEINIGRTEYDSELLQQLRDYFAPAELIYDVEAMGEVYTSSDTEIELPFFEQNEIPTVTELLFKLPALQNVKLSSEQSFEDYKALYTARPEVGFDYSFRLFGREFNTAEESVKLKKISVGDNGIRELYEYLPYMPKLTYLSFDRCNVSNVAAAQLRDDFPQIKIAWRIYFAGFTCMTDVEKIWAIGGLDDEDTEPLKYCTDVKYLDLGHDDYSKIDFIKYMPNLEVAIFSLTDLDDLTPVKYCPKLEYLEVFRTHLTDISPVASLKNLKHLHIGANPMINDISCVYDLPLERFYLSQCFSVPQEQIEHYREINPDCDVYYSLEEDLEVGAWRYIYSKHGNYLGLSDRYALLREQFGYGEPFADAYLYEIDGVVYN